MIKAAVLWLAVAWTPSGAIVGEFSALSDCLVATGYAEMQGYPITPCFKAKKPRIKAKATQRNMDCKAEANFALQLFKDREKFPIVNVRPEDEHMLELIRMHKGTGEELWARVWAECMGVRS